MKIAGFGAVLDCRHRRVGNVDSHHNQASAVAADRKDIGVADYDGNGIYGSQGSSGRG